MNKLKDQEIQLELRKYLHELNEIFFLNKLNNEKSFILICKYTEELHRKLNLKKNDDSV